MNIGSCWKKESQSGKKYLSGVIQSPFLPDGELRFAIFAVDEKKSDNSPDYNIVWSKAKKQTDTQNTPDDSNIPF